MPRPTIARVTGMRALTAAVAASFVVALSITPASALPLDPDTPTQGQVEAARAATGEAESAVAVIESEYRTASDQLAAIQRSAAVAAEAWNAARLRLDEARTRASEASRRADAAAVKAAAAAASVRAYAVQVYTTQGGLGDVEAYLTPGGPQQVADRSSMLSVLGENRAKALVGATTSANAATEARRTADLAARQLAQAEAASAAAHTRAQLRDQQARGDLTRIDAAQQDRVARLAQLRNTTVALEQARQDGLARQAAAEEAARQAALARAAADAAAEQARQRAAADQAARESAARDAAAAEAAAQAAAAQAAADAAAAQAAADAAAQAQGQSPPPAPAPAPAPAPPPPATGGSRQAVIDYAYAQLGKPYLWGGAGPDAFDCSGLTMRAYQQIGVYLPHLASAQYSGGRKIPLGQLEPGDLVFFGPSGDTAYHVGLYIGNNQMINAPNSRSVVRIDNIYWFGELVPYGARY